MPVFKVPNTIIPEDEILCVWKDDQNETEVSIAFGTLVPFFSTGIKHLDCTLAVRAAWKTYLTSLKSLWDKKKRSSLILKKFNKKPLDSTPRGF